MTRIPPVVWVVCAFLALAIFQVPEVFTGNLRWGEAPSFFLSTRFESVRLLLKGELPLFTDRYYAGHPIYSAAYGGFFYPPNWLYILLREHAFNFLKAFHVFMGGMGMYIYLRARRLLPAAAYLGGLFFSTCTFLLNHWDHVNFHEGATLAPWGGYLAFRLMRSPAGLRAALLGLFIALQISTGYVQTVLMTICWFGIEWLAAFRFEKKWVFATLWMALAGVFGLGLTAVQILPTIEHTAQSLRSQVSLEAWYGDSLPFSHLVLNFHPMAFGSAAGGDWRGTRYAAEAHGVLMPLGSALALVPLILIRRFRKHPLFRIGVLSAAGAGLAFLLAFGKYISGYDLLFNVPPFNMFRVPSRWVFLVCVFGSTLSGIGVHLLFGLRKWRAGFVYLGAYILLAVFSLVAWFLSGADRPRLSLYEMAEYKIMTHLFSVRGIPHLGGLPDHYGLYIVLPLLGFLPLVFLKRLPIAVSGILTLIVCAQWLPMVHYFHFGSSDMTRMFSRDKHPVISSIPRDEEVGRLFLVTSSGTHFSDLSLPPNFNVFMGLPTLNGISALHSLAVHQRLRIGINGVSWVEDEYFQNTSALRHMAVTHLLVEAGQMSEERRSLYETGIPSRYVPIMEAHGTVLLRLVDPKPRFDLASSWRAVGSDWGIDGEGAVDAALWNREGLPFDEIPAFLENARRERLPLEGAPIHRGTVEVQEVRSSYHRVRVSATEPQVLLIRDTHWRGWEYRIDGEGSWRDVRRAMMLYRYVPVPAGDHIVEMRYQPPGWKRGLKISLVSLLLIVVAATSPLWYRARTKLSARFA